MDLVRLPIPSRFAPAAPAARARAGALRPRPVELLPVRLPAYTPVCPLWSRLFAATERSPLVVGAAVAAALTVAFLGLDLWDGNLTSLVQGEIAPWLHVEVRSALVVSALLAGVVVTHRHEELGTRRDLERLASQLSDAASQAAGREAVRSRALPFVGLAGAILILALVPTLYQEPARFLQARTFRLPSVLFDLGVGAVLGWTTFKTLFAAMGEDRRFARLAGHVRNIDLLDLAPLHVFGRRGLRRALRWLLLVSIAALVFFDAGRAAPPALMLTGIFGFALLSFLLPVWGAHRSIRAEKTRELSALRRRIAEERKRLRASGWRKPAEGGRFADLLAYEARISVAWTWPFDARALARLALYGCLPVGSWLGSALIQHGVDAWLR